MGALLLMLLIAIAFEQVWGRIASLRPHRWHFRLALAMFWAVVLAIRAVDVLGLAPSLFHQHIPRFASDALTYHTEASAVAAAIRHGSIASLLNHQVFVYVRLLGAVYALFGSSPTIAGLLQAVFYLASLISIFLIARRFFDDRVALVAMWVLACWPAFLLHDTQPLRWGMTTAALHVAVLGVVGLTGQRWAVFLPLGLAGFVGLLFDIPYVAHAFFIIAGAFALFVLLDNSFGRARLLVAGRVLLFAFTAGLLYSVIWKAWPAGWAPGPRAMPGIEAASSQGQQPRAALSAGRLQRPGAAHGAAAGGAPAGESVDEQGRTPGATAAVVAGALNRLNAFVMPILSAREGFVAAQEELEEQHVPLGTTIPGPELNSFGDLVTNLPRAYGIALLEPTPARLLSDTRGASKLGRAAAVDVIGYYGLLILAMIGIGCVDWRSGAGRWGASFVLLLLAAMFAALGTVVLNGGTLYRMRLPYVALLIVLAAAAVTRLWDRLRSTA